MPESHDHHSKPSVMTKINASYFKICISTGRQALLRKTISEQNSNLPPLASPLFHTIFVAGYFVIWCLTLFTFMILSLVYVLNCAFHFHNLKAEFHHVEVNYLLAPWILWLLLLQSARVHFSRRMHASQPVLFKKSMKRFNIAWWASSFLTFLALASMAYAQQVKDIVAKILALVLSVILFIVFFSLLVCSTLKIYSLVHKRVLCFSTDLGSTNM
ncbi:hypothetical protein Ccrd_025295 [Cynara cardunculus var. scolymus]|uniref:Uncharacterized protein n=1 Tax=Cynara cardunculus var. scolymus TaxID=59895 RepID=A0A103XB48_CYNCS|nr:hypothetical protein Ccrd_025295 [Cynara cardunculus var. scolymus]